MSEPLEPELAGARRFDEAVGTEATLPGSILAADPDSDVRQAAAATLARPTAPAARDQAAGHDAGAGADD